MQYPEAAAGSTVSCKLDCNAFGTVNLVAAFGSLSAVLSGGAGSNMTAACPITLTTAATTAQAAFYIAAYGTLTTGISDGYLTCTGTAANFAPWALGAVRPLMTRAFNFGGRRNLATYVRGSK